MLYLYTLACLSLWWPMRPRGKRIRKNWNSQKFSLKKYLVLYTVGSWYYLIIMCVYIICEFIFVSGPSFAGPFPLAPISATSLYIRHITISCICSQHWQLYSRRIDNNFRHRKVLITTKKQVISKITSIACNEYCANFPEFWAFAFLVWKMVPTLCNILWEPGDFQTIIIKS